MVILYSTTLLILCVNSVSFWQIPWDFLHRQSCHLQRRTVLFFPFSSMCLLFYFLALLHWLGLPVLLSESVESRHSCLVPDPRWEEKNSNFLKDIFYFFWFTFVYISDTSNNNSIQPFQFPHSFSNYSALSICQVFLFAFVFKLCWLKYK